MTTTAPVRTERLDLRPVAGDDLAALYALHSDPAVWTHFRAARTRPSRMASGWSTPTGR